MQRLGSALLVLLLAQASHAFAPPGGSLLPNAGLRSNAFRSTPHLRAPPLRMAEIADDDALPMASFKAKPPPPPPPPQGFVPPTAAAPPAAAPPGAVPEGAVRAAPSAYVDEDGFVDPSQQALATKKRDALAGRRLQYPEMIGFEVPNTWVENRDFVRQGRLNEGDLVMIARSDGTTRFGEVARKTGFFWQDLWEVVVSTEPNGAPGAKRVEEGVMLGRPASAALASLMSGATVVQGSGNAPPPPPPSFSDEGNWV